MGTPGTTHPSRSSLPTLSFELCLPSRPVLYASPPSSIPCADLEAPPWRHEGREKPGRGAAVTSSRTTGRHNGQHRWGDHVSGVSSVLSALPL